MELRNYKNIKVMKEMEFFEKNSINEIKIKN